MSKLQTIDAGELNIDEQSELVWVMVEYAAGILWEDNLKKHWNDGIIKSLVKYGYQDKARYDSTLDAIKHGNGRVWCLHLMEESGEYHTRIPRGIAVHPSSQKWAMQIEVGIDALDRFEATAYAHDANNLTLGKITAEGLTEIWEQGIVGQVKEMRDGDNLPVSIPEREADFLIEVSGMISKGSYVPPEGEGGDGGGTAHTDIVIRLYEYDQLPNLVRRVRELVSEVDDKAEIDVK